ncbi:hypothetical protein GYB43_04375 [bacterium]|nr:hypothetical protein [bacterium]
MFPKPYDGPELLKGNMPTGYGRLDFGKLRSNLGGRRHFVPTEDKRFTAYLRNEIYSGSRNHRSGNRGRL